MITSWSCEDKSTGPVLDSKISSHEEKIQGVKILRNF